MGRRVLQRIQSDRLTKEASVSLIYDDVTNIVTDVEVVNALTIPVTVQIRDPRDGDLIPNTPRQVNAGLTVSLTTGQRSALVAKGIRRRAHSAAEAMTWTPEELAAQVEVIFLPVEVV